MKREERSKEKINNDMQSAAMTFLGLHMVELIKRISEFDNSLSKKRMIEEYYANQEGFHDKKIRGTTTRINAVLRIIRAEEVVYVLEQITISNSSVSPSAKLRAKETLHRIKTGEIVLPLLE